MPARAVPRSSTSGRGDRSPLRGRPPAEAGEQALLPVGVLGNRKSGPAHAVVVEVVAEAVGRPLEHVELVVGEALVEAGGRGDVPAVDDEVEAVEGDDGPADRGAAEGAVVLQS